ncbi:piezo-type mechanosensitive ion channel component 2 isoform X1 [Lingula anatina]|uniref:Piezo-type mechanosensitive ion channel component 2 isoform X1 n=1 Tax=Lingula anatina TaxID=7574 RepID=A0A1S3HPU6_LINAN|nr:piezo-type mechanosensitive ion channel component 2 isoform X1 [Lingula anatina]|eukprot:XP_013388062.1 piezo-type mechanosensitive ion channel component 2 isoform X1 [Lingula anatina]
MFEDDSDEDTISTDIHLGRDEDEDEGTEEEDRKPGPMELLTTALEQGTGAALDKAQVPTEGEHTGEEQPPGQSGTEDSATGPSTTQTGASGADGGRGGGGEDGAEEEEEETEATKWQKVKNYLKLGVAFFGSLLDSFINLLNDISRDYRLVARILEREKDQKKEEIKVRNHGGREMEDSTRADQSDEEAVRKPAEVRIEVEPSSARDNMTLVHLETLEQQAFDDLEYLERHSRIYRLLSALYTAIISRTELLCYFFMILNQMLSASLLSLPYPFAVFMWGMLSVPRPAKVFWITIITYTEAVVVLKYLFQFEFFPWNSEVLVHKDDVFWPPRILGIEKKDNYATVDLFLLLILFIHRSVLKGYGLWKDEQSLEEDFRKAEASERSHPGSPEDENVTLSTEAGAASDEKESSGETAAEEDEQGEEEGEEEEEMLDEEEEEETKKKKKKKRKRKPTMSWTKSVKEFYQNMTNPLYNATADAYAPMFACDFINFLIIMFGYWAFGPPTAASGDASSVATYISENRIPWPFLVMLIVQFVLIVVDRALYLKKDVFGKFAFQIILVLVLHIWVFFALPAITERKFVDNVPANLWYFVKCVYFGLSAYQIRCGYPTRILGNFLTKSYNYLNLFLFKGFLAIPFLLELRALMDWIWTDTTLALGSWLQMEDIYANIYVLKCWRTAEDKYPTPRGNPRRAIVKYGFGGLVLFLIIFIIWFPLVLFSFANTVYLPNPPIECRISVELAGYLPLYQMNAQPGQIYQFTDQDYRTLQDNYKMDNDVQAFLSIYEAKDTVRIEVLGTSTATWAISPPTMMDMVKDLNDTKKDIKIRLKVEMIRDPKKGQSANIISQWFERPLNKSQRIELARIVNTSNTFGSLGSIYVLRLLPKFLQVPVNGRPSEVRALKEGSPLPTNISLTLKRGDVFNNESTSAEWWEVQEFVRGRYNLNSNDKLVRRDYLTLVAFSERVAPPGFDLLTGYGIIGLYLSFILVIGRIFRYSTTGLLSWIMFRELPYVDRILSLCLNIYLVREMKDFKLEEELLAKLLFVYRSSETMIKWTRRPKQD